MKNMVRGVAAMLALALVAGCSGSKGDQFLGKWENTIVKEITLEIVRNDDNFIVRQTSLRYLSNTPEVTNIPATYKDGALQIQSALGNTNLVIDKTTGHLISGRGEYVRAK